MHPACFILLIALTQGGHGGAGVSFCYLARIPDGQKHRYGYHGHSYVAAIEFGPDGPMGGASFPSASRAIPSRRITTTRPRSALQAT
jgi:hypothetical protein